MDSITKDYKPTNPAKALIIGHDPTLRATETKPGYAFFADYYFKKEPHNKSENRKYMLAKKTFEQIVEITGGKIRANEIYVTNLCNKKLPHSDGVVRIPKEAAVDGVARIREILKANPTIQYVFPMSLQVNYWLQELGFYTSNDGFLENTRPKENNGNDRKFKPRKGRTFLLICGKQYKISNGEGQIVIPILHTKQYPLKGYMMVYDSCYKRIQEFFHAQ